MKIPEVGKYRKVERSFRKKCWTHNGFESSFYTWILGPIHLLNLFSQMSEFRLTTGDVTYSTRRFRTLRYDPRYDTQRVS